MLNPYIPGRSIGGGRPFVQALSDILRRRDRPGIENTLDIALHVAEEHVARRHEAARRTVQPGPLGKSGVSSLARMPTIRISMSTLMRSGRPVRVSSALICTRPSIIGLASEIRPRMK